MIIRKFTMEICLVRSCVFYPITKSLLCIFQWRNRTKHNFKLNLLAIITFDRGVTDFNQIKSILKLRSCSRQPMKFHVPLILSNCKINLSKSGNILLGYPVCGRLPYHSSFLRTGSESFNLVYYSRFFILFIIHT